MDNNNQDRVQITLPSGATVRLAVGALTTADLAVMLTAMGIANLDGAHVVERTTEAGREVVFSDGLGAAKGAADEADEADAMMAGGGLCAVDHAAILAAMIDRAASAASEEGAVSGHHSDSLWRQLAPGPSLWLLDDEEDYY